MQKEKRLLWCKQPTRCNKFHLLIFLLVFLNQLYMFRATNSPTFRSTFWLYIQFLVQRTDIAAGRQQYRRVVPKTVYRVKKCSWRWASLSPETCTADLKIPIKRSINGICCILLVAYVFVLMMHGLTNVKRLLVSLRISACLSVCPFVRVSTRPHGKTRLPLDEFS